MSRNLSFSIIYFIVSLDFLFSCLPRSHDFRITPITGERGDRQSQNITENITSIRRRKGYITVSVHFFKTLYDLEKALEHRAASELVGKIWLEMVCGREGREVAIVAIIVAIADFSLVAPGVPHPQRDTCGGQQTLQAPTGVR